MTDFFRKYGGTRQSIPDNVPVRPICPTHGRIMSSETRGYYCSDCDTVRAAEQLRGLTWVRTDTGRVVISPPSTQVD